MKVKPPLPSEGEKWEACYECGSPLFVVCPKCSPELINAPTTSMEKEANKVRVNWANHANELEETIAALRSEIRTLEREISELPLSTTILQNVTAERNALRAENERLRKAFPFHAWSEERDQLKAEIERLRAALEATIEPMLCGYSVAEGESFDRSMALIQNGLDIARAALKDSSSSTTELRST